MGLLRTSRATKVVLLTPDGMRRAGSPVLADAVVGEAAAAVVSGLPSTVHVLATGRDPLEATRAAGRLALRHERRPERLLLAAAVVHTTISVGWAVPIAALLPRRHPVVWGASAGLAIAALDLGVIGRRRPEVRRLHLAAQTADHVAYGAVVAAVVDRRRRRRP